MKTQQKLIPDFMIIGAMKCATSSLHDQLAEVPGIHMTNPKEPNFFSDDENYKKGWAWYSELLSSDSAQIRGESSTHYTKLPTHPKTIERMLEYGIKNTKFIYVIRHPIDRLISHYIHQWSEGQIQCDLNTAVQKYPELIDYSRYYYQISEFLKFFPKENLCILFFERIKQNPQHEFSRTLTFLEYPDTSIKWNASKKPSNVSSERLRKFPMYELLINNQVFASIRRTFVPKVFREMVKSKITMRGRPQLSNENISSLKRVFDEDLAQLACLVDLDGLNTDSYNDLVKAQI